MAIAVLDDVMLREPRLLVPGMQPVGQVKVDKQFEKGLLLAYVPGYGDISRKQVSPTSTTGRGSRGQWVGASGSLAYVSLTADSYFLPTDANISFLFYIKSIGLFGTGQSVSPYLGAASVAYRCSYYLADSTFYFDYGGATEGATRISTAVNTSAGTYIAVMVTINSGGMKIFINGSLKNSNSATPTRLQHFNPIVVGDGFGGTSEMVEHYLVAIWNYGMPASDAAELSRDPYQFLIPA